MAKKKTVGAEAKGSAALASLTSAQRAALDACTSKQRVFVLAFLRNPGNASAAGREAGLKPPHNVTSAKMMARPTVRAAIEALRAPVEASEIADANELRRRLTTAVRTGKIAVEGMGTAIPLEAKDWTKSVELLGRSQGAFLDRSQVEVAVDVPAAIIEARRKRQAAEARAQEGSHAQDVATNETSQVGVEAPETQEENDG